MLAVAKTGKGKVELVERPKPVAKGDFVVVKIHVAPMCTEFKGFQDDWTSDWFGHEAAGEVVEVAQPGGVNVGDRVVVMPQYPCGRCALCLAGDYIHCENNIDVARFTGVSWPGTATYAQYLLKPDWLLLPIPEGMSYEHASMACCGLGPTFGAMELMKVDAFDTVLITGLGPVGLGGVINARYRGARVIGADNVPYRADLARRLGAEAVVNPSDRDALDQLKRLSGGVGVDKAVECSGVGAAAVQAIRAVRRKGQVTLVGASGDFTLNGWGDVISKGLALHGAWHWNLGDARRIFRVIQESGEQIDRMITHVFPMRDIRKAWELQAAGNCGKVLLKPWE